MARPLRGARGAKALHVFAALLVDVDIELRHGAVTAKAASRGTTTTSWRTASPARST
jgi:hypothetical protein